MPDSKRVRVLVSGRVQGVFFRDSTRRMAVALGLRGWVRNLADGRVEALFEGPGERVEQAVAWCREGPPAASVAGVVTSDEPAGEPLGAFEVRATVRASGA